MFRKMILLSLLVFAGFGAGLCLAERIPAQIGNWRVEVGAPGNEFYERPEDKKKENIKPPSEALLRWSKLFSPGFKVSEWELDDGEYDIRCKRGDEEYKYEVTAEGGLLELKYENNETDIEEEADELVLKGTKKSIAVGEAPAKALGTLGKAYPGVKPSKAWTAETIAGRRYVIQVGQMAFYARPDGQIQAGKGVHDGGLTEIYPPKKKNESKEDKKRREAEFKAELDKLLGRYQGRFNFENQIKRLGKGPKSADGSYRYIVMGDSRSQWGLWSNIVRHINSLEPKPAFIINSGDLVPSGYVTEFANYLVPPLLEIDIPFFVAIGNHDEGTDDKVLEYRYLFGTDSLNYYFDYGGARYIFFDNVTDIISAEKGLAWLEKVLAGTPVGFRKYVSVHKPPKNIERWAYHAWGNKESKVFTNLMTKYGVSEVYMGHIHAYSTTTFDGVKYTLSGGGGAGLHARFGPLGNVHHYVICDVAADGTVKQRVVRFYKIAE